MNRRRAALVTAATLPAAAVATLAVHAAPAGAVDTGTPAVSAYNVIDSVGVNVHTYFQDTSYADNPGTITLVKNLGLRHVRDTLAPNRPDQLGYITNLGNAGVRSELILNGTNTGSGLAVDPNQIANVSSVAPYVDGIEPANEYDCWGGSAWAANLHTYAQNLRDAVAGTPSIANQPVLAPAFCHPESVATYGAVAGSATQTNGHDYAGGLKPELAVEARVPAWRAALQPDLPMVLTETGYTNALNAPGSITEATAADYTLRTLLDADRLGVTRTYLYELRDQKPDTGLTDPEQHYGLVRQDGTLKPAYTALQNMLTDVAGGSPAAVTSGSTAGAVPVTLTGGGSLLRSLVIKDPSGGGETLAVWLAVPLENPNTHAKLTDATRTIRVSLPGTYSATLQQPSRGNASTSMGVGTGFSVPVNGAVTLVHLRPSTARITATCSAQPGFSTLAAQYGATVTNTLAATAASWTSAPASATNLPAALASAVQIDSGQWTWLPLPGVGSAWTIALWERTDTSSASFAKFLQVDGAPAWSGLMRTYDMTSDVPSHVQLDGYGLPAAGASGGEMPAQAQPGTWHLLSLTVSGGSATFAVDGVVAGTVPSSGATPKGLYLGDLGGGFRGALGGLTVFPSGLTADQLQRLATAEPVTCAATVLRATAPRKTVRHK